MVWLKAALGYLATMHARDNILRPRQAGLLAHAHCKRVGKPLLLIHDGGLTARTLLPVRADAVQQRAYPIRVAPKAFGAVVAVGVLNQLKHPERAVAEWHRVADQVYVVSPSWLNPQAWLLPGNRYLVSSDAKSATPLWTRRRGSVPLRRMSDTYYAPPPWMSRTRRTSTPVTSTTSLEELDRMAQEMTPPATISQSDEISPGESPSPYGETDLPLIDPSQFLTPSATTSEEDDLGMGSGLSGSSPSVETLMVVSQHE